PAQRRISEPTPAFSCATTVCMRDPGGVTAHEPLPQRRGSILATHTRRRFRRPRPAYHSPPSPPPDFEDPTAPPANGTGVAAPAIPRSRVRRKVSVQRRHDAQPNSLGFA